MAVPPPVFLRVVGIVTGLAALTTMTLAKCVDFEHLDTKQLTEMAQGLVNQRLIRSVNEVHYGYACFSGKKNRKWNGDEQWERVDAIWAPKKPTLRALDGHFDHYIELRWTEQSIQPAPRLKALQLLTLRGKIGEDFPPLVTDEKQRETQVKMHLLRLMALKLKTAEDEYGNAKGVSFNSKNYRDINELYPNFATHPLPFPLTTQLSFVTTRPSLQTDQKAAQPGLLVLDNTAHMSSDVLVTIAFEDSHFGEAMAYLNKVAISGKPGMLSTH